MDRRHFFKSLAYAGVALPSTLSFGQDEDNATTSQSNRTPSAPLEGESRMMEKIRNFDHDFPEDLRVSETQLPLVQSIIKRVSKVKDRVGFGHFNLLSFDELLKAAAYDPNIGAFPADEVAYIEEVFFFDAKSYGFYGEKVSTSLTERIDKRKVIKIPGSGHFVFRGRPEMLYHKLQKDIGTDIVLTSGIRSVVKQLDLFLTKAISCDTNLSRASRSLAPPGYSFHGISDFDVGKKGLGPLNFTDDFGKTDVYKRLTDLGYVDIRYPEINAFGVRFEPWHIKVG